MSTRKINEFNEFNELTQREKNFPLFYLYFISFLSLFTDPNPEILYYLSLSVVLFWHDYCFFFFRNQWIGFLGG